MLCDGSTACEEADDNNGFTKEAHTTIDVLYEGYSDEIYF